MDIVEGLSLGLLIVLVVEVSYLVFFRYRLGMRRSVEDSILVDTSTLMDGRILEVAGAGFLSSTLIIPRSVLAELQLLADGGDSDKRARARSGLDVIKELQQMPSLEVKIVQAGRAKTGVDDQLLSLAKQYHATILTLDFNLNKVAQVEDIKVMNINRLAQSLRMSHLPGEHRKIKIVQRGNEFDQGVGYLDDGTMVVVDKAKNLVGKEIEVEFTRSLQTQAGKMMFAKNIAKDNSTTQKRNNSKKRSSNASKEDALVKLANR